MMHRLKELQLRWEQDPSSRIYLQLAEEYRRLGRRSEAIGVLEEGLGHRPRDLSGLVALGRCQLELEMLDEAIERLQTVIARDPAHIVANKLLIEAYLQNGVADQAAARLEVYRLLNDRDPELDHLEYRLHQLRELGPIPELDESDANSEVATSVAAGDELETTSGDLESEQLEDDLPPESAQQTTTVVSPEVFDLRVQQDVAPVGGAIRELWQEASSGQSAPDPFSGLEIPASFDYRKSFAAEGIFGEMLVASLSPSLDGEADEFAMAESVASEIESPPESTAQDSSIGQNDLVEEASSDVDAVEDPPEAEVVELQPVETDEPPPIAAGESEAGATEDAEADGGRRESISELETQVSDSSLEAEVEQEDSDDFQSGTEPSAPEESVAEQVAETLVSPTADVEALGPIDSEADTDQGSDELEAVSVESVSAATDDDSAASLESEEGGQQLPASTEESIEVETGGAEELSVESTEDQSKFAGEVDVEPSIEVADLSPEKDEQLIEPARETVPGGEPSREVEQASDGRAIDGRTLDTDEAEQSHSDGSPVATVTLGNLYLQQGHRVEAAKIFSTILSHDPSNEEAAAGLERAEREPTGLVAGDLIARIPAGETPEGLTAKKIAMLTSYVEIMKAGRNVR